MAVRGKAHNCDASHLARKVCREQPDRGIVRVKAGSLRWHDMARGARLKAHFCGVDGMGSESGLIAQQFRGSRRTGNEDRQAELCV